MEFDVDQHIATQVTNLNITCWLLLIVSVIIVPQPSRPSQSSTPVSCVSDHRLLLIFYNSRIGCWDGGSSVACNICDGWLLFQRSIPVQQPLILQGHTVTSKVQIRTRRLPSHFASYVRLIRFMVFYQTQQKFLKELEQAALFWVSMFCIVSGFEE